MREETRINLTFDIVLCVYKHDTLTGFKGAFESILLSTLKPASIIIVFDGWVKPTISEFVERRIKTHPITLIQNEVNYGLTFSLNKAISYSKSEWIVRVDADDLNLPGRIDESFREIEEHPCDVFGSQILEINSDTRVRRIRSVPISHIEIRQYMKKRNPMNHMSIIIRRSAFNLVGGYPDIPYAEDYALWASLMAKGCIFRNSRNILVHANVNDDFYKRRGGLRYAGYQVRLQQHLYQAQIISKVDALKNITTRLFIQLLPNSIRKYVYNYALRKS